MKQMFYAKYTCTHDSKRDILLLGDYMATKAHLEGNKRYLETQEDIKIRVPKGQRERLKQAADQEGKSLNRYILDAIEEHEAKKKPTD